jgi:HEAT repeat protein
MAIVTDELADPAPLVRQIAADRLGWLAPRDAVTTLLPLLHDASPAVRQAAAAALGLVRDDACIPHLVAVARETQDDELILQAVLSMAAYYADDIRDLLIEKLAADQFPSLARMKAAQQLWRYSDQETLELLVRLATDAREDVSVCIHASEALLFHDRRLRFPSALEAVWHRLRDRGSPHLVAVADAALAARSCALPGPSQDPTGRE